MKKLIALTCVLFAATCVWAKSPSNSDGENQRELDQLHAAVQKICPVSGAELGEHGEPVKVAVGKQKEEVFLCCAACKSGKLNASHWKTIHQNLKRAQAECPVMEKPLPERSKYTVVAGRLVYVCCPPCTDKIDADAEKFLGKVNRAYRAYLNEDK